MANATIKIDGLKALQKKLNNLSDVMVKEIKYQVEETATKIENQALANAPKFLKLINQKSTPEKISVGQFIDKVPFKNGFAFEVGIQSNSEIPIYVEFGTGSDAAQYVPTLPKEVQAAARKFFKNGKGTIARQPYLIPAFLSQSPIFIAELKKILKKNV